MGCQEVDGRVERAGELVELAVHLDADRLEGPLRRVTAGPARRRRDGGPDDLGELRRGGDRPGGDDRAGDAIGVTLVPERPEHGGEAPDVVPVDHVGRGHRLALVHAHVERTLVAEAEAPLPRVELVAADPEVEQEAGDRPDAEPPHLLGDRLERRVPCGEAVGEGREVAAGRGEGVPVPVEPDHPDLGRGLEERTGVPTPAEGGIDHDAAADVGTGHGEEDLEDLREQHRLVAEPSVRCGCGSTRRCGHRPSPGRARPTVRDLGVRQSPDQRAHVRLSLLIELMASGRSRGLPSADRRTADRRVRRGRGVPVPPLVCGVGTARAVAAQA